MLQKYFPILSEINSPLSALVALEFSAAAAEIVINNNISNEVLEALLKEAVKETETRKQEIAVSVSEMEAARVAAKKELKTASYRAAQAARSARTISKLSRRVKAVKRPATKAALKACKGLSIENCRTKAADAQSAVHVAAIQFKSAHEAVDTAINKGGDVRTIRAAVAALKVAVRTLEVRHLECRFAREMVSISLARHSA